MEALFVAYIGLLATGLVVSVISAIAVWMKDGGHMNHPELLAKHA